MKHKASSDGIHLYRCRQTRCLHVQVSAVYLPATPLMSEETQSTRDLLSPNNEQGLWIPYLQVKQDTEAVRVPVSQETDVESRLPRFDYHQES